MAPPSFATIPDLMLEPSLKIIIAEDEPQHAFLLELFLRKWGYKEVRSYDNGGDVLRALESEASLCLAILDWEMPVMDGIEVTRKLKTNGRKNIYILMVSAKTQATDRQKASAAGVDVFIAKPYEPEELRTALLRGWQTLDRIPS